MVVVIKQIQLYKNLPICIIPLFWIPKSLYILKLQHGLKQATTPAPAHVFLYLPIKCHYQTCYRTAPVATISQLIIVQTVFTLLPPSIEYSLHSGYKILVYSSKPMTKGVLAYQRRSLGIHGSVRCCRDYYTITSTYSTYKKGSSNWTYQPTKLSLWLWFPTENIQFSIFQAQLFNSSN